MTTIIELPFYPVSVNQYWRHAGNRTYIGKPGVIFRKKVIDICHRFNHKAPIGRLEVHVHLYAPDKRIRDCDNYLKSTLDSLTHGGVWADDSLIDVLTVRRMQNVKHGKTRIFITAIPEKHNEN